MPYFITKSTSPRVVIGRVDRGYQVALYESNLYDNDDHPITGLPTPGLHTRVRTFRHARGRSITPVLNRPGSMKFTLPLVSLEADDVAGYVIKRSVIVFISPESPADDPVPVWSGYISAVGLDSSGGVSVTCTGWLQFLYAREFRNDLNFTSMDAGVIGMRLFGTADNQAANENVVTGSGGTSAEDLLYGVGELDSLVSISGSTNMDVGYPVITSGWDYSTGVMPSGSGGLQLSATNKNAGSSVKLGMAFPVDPSSSYMLRALVHVVAISGAANAQLFVDWSNASHGYLSSSSIATSTAGVQELKGNVATPATAAFGQAYCFLGTGSVGAVKATFDAFYISKTDVGIRPLPLQIGVVDSPANPVGANRTRSYKAGDKIGDGIQELSDIESGFDMRVRMEKATISGGNTYLRKFDIKWTQVKTGTTIYGIGQDRPDVVFGFRWGQNNMSSMRETQDGGSMANRVNGRASGLASMAQDVDAIDEYNLWEDSVSISDPGVTSDILLGYAGAEVAYRSRPTRRFNPQPFPYDGTSKTPRLFFDYDIGDIIYAVADYGALQVGRDVDGKQPIRVFGFTVDIDEEDNERISGIQTTVSA